MGRVSRVILGHFQQIKNIWKTQLKPREGVGSLVTGMHGMPPSRMRGYVQANYRQLIPNLHFTYCIMQKLHELSKEMLWQRFWLDLCTKQVVSARACANPFLPYSSSNIKLSGKRIVQTDSCLNSEQIDTLFISVGSQEEGFGGEGSFWAGVPKLTRDCQFFFTPPGLRVFFAFP